MRATLQSKRFLSFVAACVLLVVSGCSDSAGKACDGVDGLNAACRTCVDDLPQGPNESAEACAAFAEEFGCECAEFGGDCRNSDIAAKAYCEVRGCERQPACPTPR